LTWFDEVHFLAGEPAADRRLARTIAAAPSERLRVAPWPALPAPRRALIDDALRTA
jgi:hypothetical protein